MATIHWKSFEEMDALRRQIDEAFGDLVRTAVEPQDTGWWPRVELVDTPEHLRLRIQLPGIERNNLDVQATRDMVSIAGECPYPEQGDLETHLYSDFAYGKFSRTIKMPVEISPNEIQASLQKGTSKN
jgi:HSP20 family protein